MFRCVCVFNLLTTDVFTLSVGACQPHFGLEFSAGWNKEKMSLTTQGRGNPAVFPLLGAVLLGGVGKSMRILVPINHE